MIEKQQGSVPAENPEEGPVNFEKLNFPTSVVVTSGSAIKINAVEKALAQLIPNRRFEVRGKKVSSGSDEQPVGPDTEKGARIRAQNARSDQSEQEKKESAVLSLENGIFAEEGGWEDKCVAVLELPDGGSFSFESFGVPFPTDAVEEARNREGGFKEHTVGSVIAERFGGDKQDPHSTLTKGAVTREAQLIDAVRG
jgi:non-canonical (house-cleaning) NTP pyrophosphatase